MTTSDRNPHWPTSIAWNAIAFLVALYTGAGPWYVLVVVWIAGAQLLASTYITNTNRRQRDADDLLQRLDDMQGRLVALQQQLARLQDERQRFLALIYGNRHTPPT